MEVRQPPGRPATYKTLVSELTADGLELGMRFTDTRGYEYALLALSNSLTGSATAAGEVLTYVDADTVTNTVGSGLNICAGIVEGAFDQSSATGTGRTEVLLLTRGIHTAVKAGSSTVPLGSNVMVDTSNNGEIAPLADGTAVTGALLQQVIGSSGIHRHH